MTEQVRQDQIVEEYAERLYDAVSTVTDWNDVLNSTRDIYRNLAREIVLPLVLRLEAAQLRVESGVKGLLAATGSSEDSHVGDYVAELQLGGLT